MILVTGGTGLVGAHLLYQLTSQNKKVSAIYRSSDSFDAVKNVFSYYSKESDVLFDQIDWVKADITETTSLEHIFVNVEVVYHVAALVSFDPKDYRTMRQINIDGTANIVNYAIANKVSKLCFVSSIAAIGAAINNEVVTEENDWSIENESNGYAITKYGAEMEVWRASQEGVDVIIVNPGVILGAGFWHVNTGQLFSKVARGFSYFTEGVTGFVGVTDVVKAMVALTESSIKNEGYILVSENNSFKEVLTEIAKNLEKKPPSISISKRTTVFLSNLDAFFTFISGKKRGMTKEGAKSLHSKTLYSSEKIKQHIGFEFTPIKAAIKDVCIAYKKDN